MARSRSAPPKPMPGADSPDELEARFYDALARGDIEQLMAVWADDDEIVCVHPGGGRVVGPGAIRASFEAIFANGAIPVTPEQVHRLAWLGGSLHHLVERIEITTPEGTQQAWVMATNVYLKGPQGWRLAAHHASPGMAAPPPTIGPAGPEPPATLH
jgi:ketosteroid isomerase-like protein